MPTVYDRDNQVATGNRDHAAQTLDAFRGRPRRRPGRQEDPAAAAAPPPAVHWFVAPAAAAHRQSFEERADRALEAPDDEARGAVDRGQPDRLTFSCL